MKIQVNGADVTLEEEITVEELLVIRKVEMPQYVAVQINGQLLSRQDVKTSTIKDGDVVDFLYFMGGGTW